MKRIVVYIFLTVLFSSDMFSQNTIKFLGIPIEGTKKTMVDALKAKGYVYDSVSDVLTGEFNGSNVNISVQTINNRVWRIAVIDRAFNDDETNIRIRFNRLFRQFSDSRKYILQNGEELGENENISYEITVHKKRYEADFLLADKTINGQVWYMIADRYGKYGIAIFYENLDNAANGDDL
jgi:hypothetical protein